jgi:hypothetical protein
MKKYILASLLMLSSVALADTGPFVEFGLGYTGQPTGGDNDFSLVNGDYAGWNAAAGVLFLGMGAEVGYTRFGDLSPVLVDASVPIEATHVALRFQNGIGPFSYIVKLGYAYLQQDSFSFQVFNQDIEQASQGSGALYYGIGAAFAFTTAWSIQLQYEAINPSENLPNISMTSLGVGYHF